MLNEIILNWDNMHVIPWSSINYLLPFPCNHGLNEIILRPGPSVSLIFSCDMQLYRPTFLSFRLSVCESVSVVCRNVQKKVLFFIRTTFLPFFFPLHLSQMSQKNIFFGHPKGRPMFFSPLVGWLVRPLVCHKKLRKCPTSFLAAAMQLCESTFPFVSVWVCLWVCEYFSPPVSLVFFFKIVSPTYFIY